MLHITTHINDRQQMEYFVDHCALENPEVVSRLFREYTLLIWDYLLIGKINDFYTDHIVLHQPGGRSVEGIHSVFSNTLSTIAQVPYDKQTIFLDIFAEGTPETGYRMFQTTTCYRPSEHGGQPYGTSEGYVYDEEMTGYPGMCECLIQKIDGRWKIVEEWLLRSEVRTDG